MRLHKPLNYDCYDNDQILYVKYLEYNNFKCIKISLFHLWTSLHQLSEGNSQNRGTLQESFVIKLKTLKDEYEANTASLLTVINDLQQNINTTLIKYLKDETQSLHIQLNKTMEEQEGTIKELKKTVKGHQRAIVQSYALVGVFNRTIKEQQNTIQ